MLQTLAQRGGRVALLAACLVMLTACSSALTSEPDGFDLTGRWSLDAAGSDATPPGERESDVESIDGRPRPPPFQPNDFPLLIATELVIEQDRQSMGIEYVGLTYRDVSFGERKWSGWRITAGWDEAGDLQVRMKRGRVQYRETYSLAPDRNRLVITAVVDTQRGERSIARTFRRIADAR